MENGFWSKSKYYVAIGVAALGIGTYFGAAHSDSIKKASTKAVHYAIEADETLMENTPGADYIQRFGDWWLVNVHRRADSVEELRQERQRIKNNFKEAARD